MTDTLDFSIYTSERDGKWLVATNVAPYFCFEAETEEAAVAKAREALKFYLAVKAQVERQPKEREPSAPVWHAKPARELAAA